MLRNNRKRDITMDAYQPDQPKGSGAREDYTIEEGYQPSGGSGKKGTPPKGGSAISKPTKNKN